MIIGRIGRIVTVEHISKENDPIRGGSITIIEEQHRHYITKIHSNMLFIGGAAYCIGSEEDACFGYFCCNKDSRTRIKRKDLIPLLKIINEPCVCCNAKGKLKIDFVESTIQAPVEGPPVSYLEEVVSCRECKESWTTKDNDSYIEQALKISGDESIETMLDALLVAGYPTVHIERILHLPFGLLNKWRRDMDYTQEGIALLRILYKNSKILLESDNLLINSNMELR